MSGKDANITETDLLAYADGRLDAAARAAIEQYLGVHPEAAEQVAQWQRQNEALAALYPPLTEPAPARLAPHLIARTSAAAPRIRLPQLAAAALVALALGGAVGWAARDLLAPAATASDILIDNAIAAHALYVRENRHAVEVAASDEDHLVSWLSNRIARPLNAPTLDVEGFALVGGRLLPPDVRTGTGPVAQFMYENAGDERLTVHVTAALADGATAYEFATRDTLEAFYWANDQITCTVVGDLPEAQMQAVAKKVYQQLTRRPDAGYTRGL